MLTRVMLLKVSLIGSLGVFLLAEMENVPIGWPLFLSILLNVCLGTWKAHDAGTSYVAGTMKPGKDATKFERQFYRRSRLFFHLPVDDAAEEGDSK